MGIIKWIQQHFKRTPEEPKGKCANCAHWRYSATYSGLHHGFCDIPDLSLQFLVGDWYGCIWGLFICLGFLVHKIMPMPPRPHLCIGMILYDDGQKIHAAPCLALVKNGKAISAIDF